MSNEVLFFVELIVCFGGVVLIFKFFKKLGLICWIAIASILANIITAKNVDAFGMTYTLGTILFASTFLATDILTEKYGSKVAKKGVVMGMLGSISLIIATQICLMYIPSTIDYANESMQVLFSLNLRISISSIIMYFVANMVDVYLYEKIRIKMNGKKMWVRNNISTILCNCLENFLFMLGAFYGIFEFKDIMIMALSTSLVELIAAILDTPFLYLATHKFKLEEKLCITE